MAQNSKETSDTHFCGIALHDPLNGFNIGAAIRASAALGASFVSVGGSRHQARKSDFRAMDAEMGRKKIPVFFIDNIATAIPYDCEIVLIERAPDAVPLGSFVHPRRAVYCFGPEDGSVDASLFHDKPVKKVYIPSTGSLNLGSCVYIVLYDRSRTDFSIESEKCPKCGSTHNKGWTENDLNGEKPIHCNACGHEWKVARE